MNEPTENPKQPIEPSAKNSPSDDAPEDLVPLMRLTLAKVNRLEGSEADSEIPALYERWQADRDADREAQERARRESVERGLRDMMIQGMCRDIERLGGTAPAGASEAELAAILTPMKEAAGREAAERERLARDVLRHRQAERLFARSMCPERHVLNLSRIESDKEPRWAVCRDLLIEQAWYANGFLVALLGPRGTGKTEMAVAVIRACCGRLMTCRYVKALDLFRAFRRAYTPVKRGEGGESEDDIIDEWTAPDLLVVDETHQRGESDWENNTLVNLLDRRYDARKCTILVANQSKPEFAQAMGDSVVSRIHETGDALVCDWPTFRARREGGWRQVPGAEARKPSGGVSA